MTGTKLRHCGCVCYQTEKRTDYADGIHAGPLPIIAAQTHPHPEFIEGEGHADAVEDGSRLKRASFGLSEQEERTQSGQQKNAVVEMVAVRTTQMEIKVGEAPGHDEENHNPGKHEGQQEHEEHNAGQFASVWAFEGVGVTRCGHI